MADPAAEPVLLLAGSSPAELLAQLDAPDAELLDRDDAASPPSGGPWRLALVAPSPRRLTLARAVVERGNPWRGRNDLWFTPAGLLDPARPDGTPPGQTAFLFCGLEDKFSPRIDDVCAHFGLDRPALDGTGMLGRHGVASVEVGRILDEALRRLGIVPDLVGGHSIGEWNAMISSGLIAGELADAFIAGFDPAALEVPGVVFGALGCGAVRAAEVIADLGDIVVSHDNCLHQSIICGREENVRTALERLRREGVLGQVLPFRSGFHSPFLAPYVDRLRTSLASTTLGEATIPIWSATTVAPYPREHNAVRALALRHLLEPVRFRELARRLHDTGVRAFVQVGVGSVAGFVDDTLPGHDHIALVTNSPKRSGLDQLRRVAAALWVEGAAPRLDLLPCRTRPEPPATPAPLPVSAPAGRRIELPRRRGASVRLNLGAPLVRLGPAGADLLGSTQPTHAALGSALGHPVLDELRAALADADAVMSAVVDRWALSPTAPPGSPPRRRAVPVAGGVGNPPGGAGGGVPAPRDAGVRDSGGGVVPVLGGGAPPASGSGGALASAPRTVRRRLSLASMPHIIDHCFYRQPPGWNDLSDIFPVVPMTEVLELMIEQAAEMMPGRVPIGLRDVRALRWLAIEPAVEVSVTLASAGPDAVRVTMEGYARGTVVFADDYPPSPWTTAATADLPAGPTGPVLPGERPSRHQGKDLYAGRFLFHGPGYQGIHHIEAIAAAGIRGRLRVPSASGALLDNAGQLFGYWAMETLPEDSLLLPQSLADLSFHGPAPMVGDLVDCVVRIRQVTGRTVTADMELRRLDGSVWAVVSAWTDRRFANDDVLWAMVRAPELHTVAQPSGEGWVVALDRWTDSASRELIVRHYADAADRARLAGLNPRAARGWLLGRIAVQDAVRRWLWARGAGPVWGIEVRIDHDARGAPLVGALPARPGIPAGDPPWVSLAHKPELAVALVSADGAVGIDIEQITVRAPGVEAAALAPAERDLLDRVAGGDPERRALWFTRLWAAKEAAAKAEGTGLAGRPRQFVVDGPHPPGRAWAAADWAGHAPPELVRVTRYEDGPGGPLPAGSRWVALRTVDASGQIQPEGGQPGAPEPDSGGVGDRAVARDVRSATVIDQEAARDGAPARRAGAATYVVAWTSPEVEASGLPNKKE
nr:acyltransferase domain-containing protein [Frankia tisae]